LSSAGLRVLLAAQKKMNGLAGDMIIRHINDTIKEVFDVTGFSDILTIE
jgi:anti-sigma B factor antagonist